MNAHQLTPAFCNYKDIELKPVDISKSEARMIKGALKFPWLILIALVIVIIFGIVYAYLAIHSESNAITTFTSLGTQCPEIQKHLDTMFRKLTVNTIKPALFFFLISVGLLIVSFINHIQRTKLLKKINIEKLTLFNAEQFNRRRS